MEMPGIQIVNGVTVDVLGKTVAGEDDMGEPVESESTNETVENVLFDPTASSDVADGMRMSNIEVDAEFHFPKSWSGDLRGRSISYGGRTYAVVGDIRRYTVGNVPGPWNGVVTCREVS